MYLEVGGANDVGVTPLVRNRAAAMRSKWSQGGGRGVRGNVAGGGGG